jgi:beta-glucosidase-like glycosyl hydrolase
MSDPDLSAVERANDLLAQMTLAEKASQVSAVGIPAMIHGEALNGVVAPGFTSFPTAIGLAATWDADGVRENW